MSAPQNQAAWLTKAGSPLQVGEAPLPKVGPGEIVQWPTVLGCDVSGEVYEVGQDVKRFRKGDRWTTFGRRICSVYGRARRQSCHTSRSIPETVGRDLEILKAFERGHLALTHPPPPGDFPENVKLRMIFAHNDNTAPVYREFITSALESGKLKCLPPPTVVGKGLEYVDRALQMSKAGVSATKLVVEL
ncbi:hypothetical protein E4T39_00340 [Aureobasidium subglaciale]|nr:hypothetical protein E4T39_00340 [Aureobasidium subglaciale]